MDTTKKWYFVEIPNDNKGVDKFRQWLKESNIQHETSGADNYTHFEIFVDLYDVDAVNNALDLFIW